MENLADFARRSQFVPFNEIAKSEQKAIVEYAKARWPQFDLVPNRYWWKQSGQGEWVCFKVDY